MYRHAGIECQFDVTDLMEMVSMSEQLARYLRILNSYDIKLLEKKVVDHREMTNTDLHVGCNIVSTSFFRAHSATHQLSNDSFYINALLQRQVNPNFVPPIVRAVSEVSAVVKDRHDIIDILSHLRITTSLKTITQQIEKGRMKYKSKLQNEKPIIYAVDNIDISKTKHLHTLDKEDSAYYHGTNQIAIQPNIIVPDDFLSTTRKLISEIDHTFIKASEAELDILEHFEHCTLQRSLQYYKGNTEPHLTMILNPTRPKVNNNVTPNDNGEEILPMETVIGLNNMTQSTYLSDIQHKISHGKPSDSYILKRVLTDIVETHPERNLIFVTADQAIFDLFQQIKQDSDFTQVSEKISMDMEIWHCQLTMDKAIMTSYLNPLKPLLVAIGYLSDSHVQYLAKCANLHRTHYNLEPIMIALQVEIISQFLKINPQYDIATIDTSSNNTEFYQQYQTWTQQQQIDNPHLRLWLQFTKAFNISNAAWVAQRIGSQALFRSTLTADGFSPLFFSWGRCNYDHSVVEQLLKDALESPYEQYIRSHDSHFIRFKASNSLMAIGTKQEMMVKYIKSFISKLIDDDTVTRTAQILTPIEINRQNLHDLLMMPNKYTHKFHNIDPHEVDNIRCFIQRYNLLGFPEPAPTEHTITVNERTQDHEDMGVELMLQEDDIDTHEYANIYSPHEYTNIYSPAQHSEIDYEDDAPSTAKILPVNDDIDISNVHLNMAFLKRSEYGNSHHLNNTYWRSLPTEDSIPKITSNEPVDWYTKIPINTKFLDSFSEGKKMMEAFATKVIEMQCTSQSSHLKSDLKKQLTNLTYQTEKKTQSKSSTKPAVQQIDKSSRTVLASSSTSPTNIQQFDVQFSKDGQCRHKPNKSILKSILQEKYPRSYLGKSSQISTSYAGIAVDCNYILFHKVSSSTNVEEHTKNFVDRHITPYLQKSSQLIIAFDTDQFTPLLKCQERYERTLKTDDEQICKTARAFESDKTVPLLAIRRQDRMARQHYAKMICKELADNCDHYLSQCCSNEFIIIISGIALDSTGNNVLPLYIHYNADLKMFETGTAPSLHHSIGQGEDVIFFIADSIESTPSSKWLFVSPDSDIITKALAVSQQIKFKLHVALPSKTHEYDLFDIEKLCSLIRCSYTSITYPIETFVVLLLDSGFSDFTSSWYGIGLKKSLEIFELGICHDLVSDNIDNSFSRDQIELLNWPDNLPCPSLESLKKAIVRRATKTTLKKYESYSYAQLLPIVFAEKDNARHSFPTQAGLMNHFFRIVLAFQHFTCISRHSVVPTDIVKFGFIQIDSGKPISLTNCRFDFNSKTQLSQQSKSSKSLCTAINKSNKQQCSRFATEGSVFCKQHKRSHDDDDDNNPKVKRSRLK